MNPKRHLFEIAWASCLALSALAGPCLSQKPVSGADQKGLAEFERRIASSDLTAVDGPLMSFVIANPGNAKALELLAGLRLRQGRLSESRALYQRVMQLDPQSAGARIHSARVAFLVGERDEAQRLLSEVKVSVLDSTLRLDLAATYLLVGRAQEALEIAFTLPMTVRNTFGLPLLGEIYLQLDRVDEIKGLVPLMKTAAAKSRSLALSCAEVLRVAGLHTDGIALLSSLPPRERSHVGVLVLLSRLEILSNNLPRARTHLAQAARLDANSPEVLSLQAYVENSAGNAERALQLITRARDAAPGSPAVLADFVALTLRIGKPVLAFDAAQALVSLQPGNLEFQYLFGIAALQSGNLVPARETLESYVRSRPSDFRGCLALGTVLGAQRETEKARAELTRCNELDPANAEARLQLGLSYKSQGENRQAIEMLEQAVARAPNYGLALRELGALHLESGDESRARVLLEKAAQLSPRDADTHFQLARLYNRIGETALAKQHQEIFQKLRPWGRSQ